MHGQDGFIDVPDLTLNEGVEGRGGGWGLTPMAEQSTTCEMLAVSFLSSSKQSNRQLTLPIFPEGGLPQWLSNQACEMLAVSYFLSSAEQSNRQ